jgi:DNA-directed RNA polymerase specialized sigma subunit
MDEVVWDYGVSPSADDLDPINVIIPPSIANRSTEMEFREKLKNFALPKIQIEILVRRFFYEMSLRDIAKELKIISAGTVLNQLNKALTDLKQRGFGK